MASCDKLRQNLKLKGIQIKVGYIKSKLFTVKFNHFNSITFIFGTC